MPASKKISFTDLVSLVQSGKITEKEVSRYFIRAPSTTPQFAPELAVNEKEVEVGGVAAAARASGAALGNRAMTIVREAQLAKAGAPKPDGTIVAEGDSWFNLPELGFPISVPPTLIDQLALKMPINNIAHWGDELGQIIAEAEYMTYLATGKVKFLLFSAGGNDVLGGGHLAAYLRQRVSGDNDPKNAPTYILPAYYRRLDAVEVLLRTLVENVLRTSPLTVTLFHSYDYCIPLSMGRWLGVPLRSRGFDPHWQKDMARAIVQTLIDAFKTCLEQIAADYPGSVVAVNLTGTVKVSEWWDELHPGKVAAKRLAGKFERAINALLVA